MRPVLNELRILLLEDEFLIAMDVEQICLDHGAASVVIASTVEEAHRASAPRAYDAAIIDLMVDGLSTLEFAAKLREEAVPFVFASGYSDPSQILRQFPGVTMVGKPFSGDDLVRALAAACQQDETMSGCG